MSLTPILDPGDPSNCPGWCCWYVIFLAIVAVAVLGGIVYFVVCKGG